MLSRQVALEKWLGIKEQDQPPSLYRLLGVDVFEADADIISNSADSRMGYLRQFQIGDNAVIAAAILNELSQARVVLLNAKKKLAYDAQLRDRTTSRGATAAASDPPHAAASPLPRAEAIVGPARASRASAPKSAELDLASLNSEARPAKSPLFGLPKKKLNPLVWAVAAAGVALVIGTIVVLKSISGGEDSSPAEVPKAVAIREASPKPPAAHVASESRLTPKLPAKPIGNLANGVADWSIELPIVPTTSAAPSAPAVVTREESPPPDPSGTPSARPAETPKVPAADAAADIAATASVLAPVPDAGAQAEAMKLVKEIYGNEFAAAKTADQKRALARKLFERAMESQKDPAAQFVLLRMSKEASEQASDCETALKAVEEAGRVFQIDALEMKADALRKCVAAATTSGQHAVLAEKAAEVSDQAVANDNFTVAKPMIDMALGEAKKAKAGTLVKRSSERKADVEWIAQAYEAAKKGAATLEKMPLDPDANLAVGRYKCLFKGDWEGGLPKLTIGSDPALKMLAEAELKGASSSDEQAKLGDAWWNAAQNERGLTKKQFQARAGNWYRQALPGLTGLTKDKTEKRIAECEKSDDAPSPASSSTAKWVLLFRSSDPAIWNTESNEKDRFAIPLSDAPKDIRFLKMQLNPKEFVIISIANDKLGGISLQENFGWRGDNEVVWGGHSLGIFDRKTPRHKDGDVTIHWEEENKGLSGWGFGYGRPGNYQGRAWAGRPVGTVVFEISVTSSGLTAAEKKQLLK